jgi:uridine phosphorylase
MYGTRALTWGRWWFSGGEAVATRYGTSVGFKLLIRVGSVSLVDAAAVYESLGAGTYVGSLIAAVPTSFGNNITLADRLGQFMYFEANGFGPP